MTTPTNHLTPPPSLVATAKRRLFKTVGLCATTALAGLVLYACGGGGGSGTGTRLDRSQYVARIAAKHQDIQKSSNLPIKGKAPVAPRLDELRGMTSSAQTNGRVVGMIDAWVPVGAGQSASRVSYVVYSFFSDGLLSSKAVTNSKSNTTTEVWRYAYGQQTWCPVVTGLSMSLMAVQSRETRYDSTSGKLKIDFFTGSADGVLGEIAFTDATPLSDVCDTTSLQPVASTFYTVLPTKNVDNTAPIVGMKVLDVYNADDAQTTNLTPSGEKVLFAWVGGGCNSPQDFDNSTGACKYYRSGGLLRYRYGTPPPYAIVDANTVQQILRPEDITTDVTQDCRSSGITSLGAGPPTVVDEGTFNPTDYYYRSLPDCAAYISDSRSSATNGRSVGAAISSFDALLVNNPISTPGYNGQYVLGTKNNAALTGVRFSDVNSSALPPVWKIAQVNQNTTANWCQAYELEVIGAQPGFIISQNACDALLDPSTYPVLNASWSFNTATGSYNDLPVTQAAMWAGNGSGAQLSIRYPSSTAQNQDILVGSSEFATVVNERHVKFQRSYDNQPSGRTCGDGCSSYSANTKDASGAYTAETALTQLKKLSPAQASINLPSEAALYSVSATSQTSTTANLLSLQISGFSQNPNAGKNFILPNLPPDFSLRNSAAVGMSLPQTEIFTVPKGTSTTDQQVYWLTRSLDNDPVGETNSLYTHGGIAMCVANVLPDGSFNFNACQSARAAGSAYPEGSIYTTANRVTNNSTYLSTPTGMSYTVSPDNQVFVNYFAANGGIFTINATNPNSDWGNWTRVSVGQSTQCTQTLKLPPVPQDAPWWAKLLLSLVEIAITTALPEAAGLIVEIGLAVGESLIPDDQSVELLNGVALERDCKVGS
jgi:hypothetical protein